MSKIYVPVNDVNDFSCYVIFDMNTIRAYPSRPMLGDNAYTDFFINSHYMEKSGVQVISSSVELPQCEDISRITNEYSYRNDFAHIIVIFSFFVFILLLGLRLLCRLFGKYGKL